MNLDKFLFWVQYVGTDVRPDRISIPRWRGMVAYYNRRFVADI
jgi:hypothetical protein